MLIGFLFVVGISPWAINAQDVGFSVHIARPGEGETFYAGPTSLMYSIPINGWVSGYGTNPVGIEVWMELFENEVQVGSLTAPLKSDGTFDFYVAVNPDATEGQFPPELGACAFYCHTPTSLSLPSGALKLRVTAMAPEGETAYDERYFFVDRSGYASVPVKVVHAEHPDQIIAGLPVQASTRLYMWRARLATGSTDDQGYAIVKVESLSQTATKYVFRIEPAVVNGVRYEGTESVEVTLPPGAIDVPPITITVTSQSGQINGMLHYEPGIPNLPVSVSAIRLSDGTRYQSDILEDREFSFPILPIDRYLIMADNLVLENDGLSTVHQEVDLNDDIQPFVEIPVYALDGNSLAGTVYGEQGTGLPFAWLTLEDTPATIGVLPDSGVYTLNSLPLEPQTLYVSAPGYYTQKQFVELTSESDSHLDFSLFRQSGTKSLPWGDGEVFVPAETLAEIGDHSIFLEYGWLWGHGGDAQPFLIQTNSVNILLSGGEFALELLPNRSEWLYVLSGQAKITSKENAESLTVQADQMVNLIAPQALVVFPYDPVVLSALQPIDENPLHFVWKPTIVAQFQEKLTRIGVGSAQLITFITYIIGFLSLVLTPVAAIYWWWKHNRSSQRDHMEGKNDDEI